MSAAIGKNRRARLAIPKVNQNPRVGSARPIVSGRRGLAQNVVAATSTATTATTPAQPGNTVPSTQRAPIDPLAATSGATQPPPSG